MPTSKPLQMFAVRLSEEDRARLDHIAAERHLTLSEVLREGLRLVARDARDTTNRSTRAAS